MVDNIYRRIALAALLFVLIYSPVLANDDKLSKTNLREQGYAEWVKKKNYPRWIGAKAPDLGPNGVDRIEGQTIKLDDHKGKRILLYSFDTGNFVKGPSEEEQIAILQLLYKALDIRDKVGRNKFEIIGFTRGYWFWDIPPDNELPEDQKHLLRFKDLLLVNTNRVLPEPYDLLRQPGCIVIDRNGIIREFIPRALTEEEIRRVAEMGGN
jgi:hypothetical protein